MGSGVSRCLLKRYKVERMFYHDQDLRSPSELCVRCGLCCIVLRATCTREEAEEASPSCPEQFAEPHPEGEDDKLLIRFPCMHLRGRPLGAVFCAIYHQKRPEVCSTYLCRIAMLYSQHEVGLESALRQLKVAFWSEDPTVFNWAGFDGERNIMRRQVVWKLAENLRAKGQSEQGVDLWVANQCTPSYWPSTPLEHSLFSMHFAAFDNREDKAEPDRAAAHRKALELYYEMDELEKLNERDKEVAAMTVFHVLNQLRIYVTDRTEVLHESDSVEADRPTPVGRAEAEPGVPTPTMDEGNSGSEGGETGLCSLPGDQDDCETPQ